MVGKNSRLSITRLEIDATDTERKSVTRNPRCHLGKLDLLHDSSFHPEQKSSCLGETVQVSDFER
eukprot:m.286057 g.286057  ORF g.286057 m.286057 type:complete len:65 (-) comp182768_c0_seq1:8-202(-)